MKGVGVAGDTERGGDLAPVLALGGKSVVCITSGFGLGCSGVILW